ncbi:DER1-domain-containing protein [Agrocybe pediades]|nr:DER1-domain-containing protein [Agrocybe pediades]
MDQFVAELKKIPPVTRFVCGSSLAVTLSVAMKALSPYKVLFVPKLTFGKLQLWRLHTAFFLGSGDLSYLFDFIMLYRTVNDLELRSYSHRSSDFAWQLFWACGSIILATRPLNAYIFPRSLLLCLVYLYSSLAPPGATTSIMGLVTVPIKFYPYVLITFDLIMGGPSYAAQSVAGAVVGHAWWWTVWGGELGSQGLLTAWSRAPQWVRKFMGETNTPTALAAGGAAAGLERSGIHVTAPRDRAQPAGGTTGHNWGRGQTLGS